MYDGDQGTCVLAKKDEDQRGSAAKYAKVKDAGAADKKSDGQSASAMAKKNDNRGVVAAPSTLRFRARAPQS